MNEQSTKSNRVTIYDLARSSGMSIATVSRALKNDPLIKQETRERIQWLAQKLHYRPSIAASRLAKGRTGLIGLLLPNMANPFYTALAAAIQKKARENNYEITMGFFEKNTEQVLESFVNMHLDGIIMELRDWTQNRELIAEIASRPGSKPIVLRRRVEPDFPLDAIFPDLEGAAKIATQYLLNLGHRNIGFIGSENEERGRSFKQTIAESGIPDIKTCFSAEVLELDNVYQEARKLLSAPDRPTALLVSADYYAFAALRAAGELGIRIPADLSIVGFDDVELSSYGYVPLTTMRMDIADLANLLMERLLARINKDDSPPQHKLLQLELIERASSGPPPHL